MSGFVVTPKKSTNKTDESVIMSIRIKRTIQEQYTNLADKSNRSRNEIIAMALIYALENLQFIETIVDHYEKKD